MLSATVQVGLTRAASFRDFAAAPRLTDGSPAAACTDRDAHRQIASIGRHQQRPRAWLHRPRRYGQQKRRASDYCEVFVLTSPSSAARRYWKIDPWRDLADWLRATRPWRF